MMATFFLNTTFACCSGAITILVYNYFHQERNEVLFFYGNSMDKCNIHSPISTISKSTLKDINCSVCNLQKIIGWLNEAKETLDICMYMLTHKLLIDTVFNAYKRGVRVRLIINSESFNNTWEMSLAGIKVQQNTNNDFLMHHKFIIIDNNKVILGSLNWTASSINNNWENVYISNERVLVNAFRQEFQRLLKQFDNITNVSNF